MIVTKVKIVENDDSLTNAIYIHDDIGTFNLFIDENQKLRTEVKLYTFVSGTEILKI